MIETSAVMAPLGVAVQSAPSSGLGFWLVLLALLAVVPFLLTIITPFAKFVIVFGITRHALGLPQIPPNTVITGLALILTVHTIAPVAETALARYEASADTTDVRVADRVIDAIEAPMTDFLSRNASDRYIALFESLGNRLRAGPGEGAARSDSIDAAAYLGEWMDPELADRTLRALTVLAPAFMLTELTEAFQVGFLIFIPFLIIDLLVSNVLLAMGMHMMAPTPVALPLKLLLFVLVAGWEVVIQGLVLGYA